MGGLLEGGGAGGPDELRSIVARAGRRRLRLAGIVGAAALAAGGGIGYGISSAASGGSTQQIVATSPQSGTPGGKGAYTAPNVGAPAGANSSIAAPGPSQYKKLFTRHVGSIDIRGFTISMPTPLPYEGAATCLAQGTRFQAEVSTPNMVAFAGGLLYPSSSGVGSDSPIFSAEPWLAGVSEGDPTAIIVAQTTSNVALLKMDFSVGGTDQMAPVEGWSALAAPWPGGKVVSYGTLTAFDHSGHVLSTMAIPSATPGVPPLPGGAGTVHSAGGGTASSRTGSSGAGSSGAASSGTASSGSGSTGPAVSASPATATVSPPAIVTSPPASLAPAAVFPCKVPPQPGPNPIPCPPLKTSNGATYACPALPPANTTTTAPRSGSGG